MKRRLLYTDPSGATYLHYDDTDDVVIEKVFNPATVIEHAQRMRNEVRQTGELRKVMGIPFDLLHKLRMQGKLGEEAVVDGKLVLTQKAVEALMRDPEYAKLRYVDKL